jgi:hypothetical protein
MLYTQRKNWDGEGDMPDEKFDEKELEKREEKSPEEKSWDEKYRRDPLGALVWPAILIWAGLVLLAGNLGFLDSLRRTARNFPGGQFFFQVETWGLIFIGAGVIVLIEVVIRLLMPVYRRDIGGTLFFAILLIAIGLGNMVGWNFIWPLILIGLGLSIVLRAISR